MAIKLRAINRIEHGENGKTSIFMPGDVFELKSDADSQRLIEMNAAVPADQPIEESKAGVVNLQ